MRRRLKDVTLDAVSIKEPEIYSFEQPAFQPVNWAPTPKVVKSRIVPTPPPLPPPLLDEPVVKDPVWRFIRIAGLTILVGVLGLFGLVVLIGISESSQNGSRSHSSSSHSSAYNRGYAAGKGLMSEVNYLGFMDVQTLALRTHGYERGTIEGDQFIQGFRDGYLDASR